MRFTKNQVIVTGFIFHILAAYFSIGYHQCDELFQVFEFAGYKLGLNSAQVLPWEFAEQIRSGIQPLLVYLATFLLKAVSITNPFQVAMFLRFLMAIVSFFVIKKFISLMEKEIKKEELKIYLWGFGLLFWCLPYFHVRQSSENFSSVCFIFALNLILESYQSNVRWPSYLIAGFTLGMSFLCRFQFSFMIGGLLAWLIFIARQKRLIFVYLFCGMLAALGFGLMVDKWLYGKWVLSWWNYLYQNVFEDKASIFGKSPFYFYFTETLLQLIPPFSIMLIAALIGFWWGYKKHPLTWITFPFVLLHFFVAHKELRFLFPVLNFFPLMVLLFFQHNELAQKNWFKPIISKGFLNFAVTINILLLCFFTFKPADDTSKSLERIYNLIEGNNPVLYYEETNPYNNQASLNYFRNPKIKTIRLETDTLFKTASDETYFISEKNYSSTKNITIHGKTFTKIYSNFPAWFSYLNFNGWLDRAYNYSIFRKM